ncbi:hypothetical protein LMG23994_01136 [Cupriavidus pinatubonensis]|uniref:Uncharacterized protein n=1 Tax=Cupriavidus pinatubonensis TaxID=248026 RepID=A0ABN7Y3U6_9BURK|nr:hypothetical protein LMG23994_01136 [Cupriavidus pinatubonensis]
MQRASATPAASACRLPPTRCLPALPAIRPAEGTAAPARPPPGPQLKLHADQPQSLNTVTAYGPDYIEINLIRHTHSVLVLPEGEVRPWPVQRFEDLEPDHFETLAELGPEVVLLGTGSKLRFPHPRLTASLARKHVGVDAMDMQAACRTYNILMAEGRKVAAVLLLEPEATDV